MTMEDDAFDARAPLLKPSTSSSPMQATWDSAEEEQDAEGPGRVDFVGDVEAEPRNRPRVWGFGLELA